MNVKTILKNFENEMFELSNKMNTLELGDYIENGEFLKSFKDKLNDEEKKLIKELSETNIMEIIDAIIDAGKKNRIKNFIERKEKERDEKWLEIGTKLKIKLGRNPSIDELEAELKKENVFYTVPNLNEAMDQINKY